MVLVRTGVAAAQKPAGGATAATAVTAATGSGQTATPNPQLLLPPVSVDGAAGSTRKPSYKQRARSSQRTANQQASLRKDRGTGKGKGGTGSQLSHPQEEVWTVKDAAWAWGLGSLHVKSPINTPIKTPPKKKMSTNKKSSFSPKKSAAKVSAEAFFVTPVFVTPFAPRILPPLTGIPCASP